MKNITKLWFTLALLISAEFITCVEAQESNDSQVIVTEIQQDQTVEESSTEEAVTVSEETVNENENETENNEKHLNKKVTALFVKFFNENDTMSFSTFVHDVVILLKEKRNSLDKSEHAKCDELIKTLEVNKQNYNFAIWAKILISKSLHELLPEESRTYIFNVPNHVKVKALIQKLRNGNNH